MRNPYEAFFFFLTLCMASGVTAADPWADAVVNYTPGSGVLAGFDDATTALGAPTRFTSPASPFGGLVTPFNSPFGADEVVTIGEGGSLTVRFDEPVTDDPGNPFGIDLLLFGNSFLGLSAFPADASTTATGVFSEGGQVWVSTDGTDFVEVVGVEADGRFPTLGYTDIVEPFAPSDPPPTGLTDFTRPVDPSANVVGLNTAQIVALYDGSGGGAGIDLAPLGLSEISYVRITNPENSGVTPEIDALADVRAVPEPGALALVLLATPFLRRRR